MPIIIGIMIVCLICTIIYFNNRKEKNNSIKISPRHSLFFNMATKIAKTYGNSNIRSYKTSLIYTYITNDEPQITYTIINDINNKTTRIVIIKSKNKTVFHAKRSYKNEYEGMFEVLKFINGSWTNYLYHATDSKLKSPLKINEKMRNIYKIANEKS